MKRWVKITGLVGLSLGVVVGTAVFGAIEGASALLDAEWDVTPAEIPVPWPMTEAERSATLLRGLDPDTLEREQAVARGEHIVTARGGCGDCHGADGGGGVIMSNPPMGTWVGPNLTGRADLEVADWVRAIRHGIASDGTASTMPSIDYMRWSDQEISDVIAYVRSLPPVTRELPEESLGPVRAILYLTGGIPLSVERIDHEAPRPAAAPAPEISVAYGEHMALTCVGCHGMTFAGGPIEGGDPSWPPATNLTPHADGLYDWSEADFIAAMRDGVRPDGSSIAAPMPTAMTAKMTDVELKAMYAYLGSLAPLPTGAR